jgi:ATP-dependent DNA helicase DinG
MAFNLFLANNKSSFCIYNVDQKSSSSYSIVQLPNMASSNKIIVCNKVLFNFKHNNIIDILELAVFLFPNISASPTINGLAKYFNIDYIDTSLANQAETLAKIYNYLLNAINNFSVAQKQQIKSLAIFMQQDNWSFAENILEQTKDIEHKKHFENIWQYIPNYKPKGKSKEEFVVKENNITLEENLKGIVSTLENLTANYQSKRQSQEEYALTVAKGFVKDENNPNDEFKQNFILAQAGTGIGKTLGYLAPSIWFLKNNPDKQVLISTYSKGLQKQIFETLKTIVKQKEYEHIKFASIKGANNYLCLLNYQNLLNNASLFKDSKIMLGILARALLENLNGDLIGGDISSIIFNLLPNNFLNYVINKKEECLYSKCKHFNNCFVFKAKFLSKNSHIIISNHHFSLLNNCLGISHVIFDEAHHLFSVSDSIFALNFSVKSLNTLKLWICGGGSKFAQSKGQLNGLNARLYNILSVNEEIQNNPEHIENTAEQQELSEEIKILGNLLNNSFADLVGDNLLIAVKSFAPKNLVEEFFYNVYNIVLQNNSDLQSLYTIEADTTELTLEDNFLNTAGKLSFSLANILKVVIKLQTAIANKVLATNNKALEEFSYTLETVVVEALTGFKKSLDELTKFDSQYIYRFIVEKDENEVINIGYFKNTLNPAKPFAFNVLTTLNTAIFTSATLVNPKVLSNKDDNASYLKTIFGLNFLDESTYNFSYAEFLSPFDYKNQSKLIIINDAIKHDIFYLQNAIIRLFTASGGGALGIFTSLNRLKSVYNTAEGELASQNINLMAQHINNQHIVNLLDSFKDDVNSCLLGTDSVRDGIDVPGGSLRLVLLEKVPWDIPDILLKKRVEVFGSVYRDYKVQLKLKQAFGRLIRTNTDKGVFVLLDKAMPSKFLTAFPQSIASEPHKVNLDSAVNLVKDFFDSNKQ